MVQWAHTSSICDTISSSARIEPPWRKYQICRSGRALSRVLYDGEFLMALNMWLSRGLIKLRGGVTPHIRTRSSPLRATSSSSSFTSPNRNSSGCGGGEDGVIINHEDSPSKGEYNRRPRSPGRRGLLGKAIYRRGYQRDHRLNRKLVAPACVAPAIPETSRRAPGLDQGDILLVRPLYQSPKTGFVPLAPDGRRRVLKVLAATVWGQGDVYQSLECE